MEMKERMDAAMECAADVMQRAARTAKHYAGIAKMKMEIRMEEEHIRKNYTKLGKLYYRDFITEAEPDAAEYEPLCAKISDSYRRITDLKQEIADAAESDDAAETACDAAEPEEAEPTESAETPDTAE